MIAILDYGLGNLRSVSNALKRLNAQIKVSSNKRALVQADAIVVIGVGEFGEAMSNLRPFKDTIVEQLEKGIWYFGICVGYQILFTGSEESSATEGLGILDGFVKRFPKGITTPHIGWNQLENIDKKCPFFKNINEHSFVYFMHSYYPVIKDKSIIAASTEHKIKFASAVWHRNIFATQFHPEKSGKVGLRILRNFIEVVKR